MTDAIETHSSADRIDGSLTVLFVHGALVRDGAWWWSRAGALLESRTGIRSDALALPSCGEDAPTPPPGADTASAGLTGLAADAAELRRALDERAPASTVLVGHSYGGTVIAEAGSHPAVAGLLLISSYLPELGQTQADIMAGEPEPLALRDRGAGRLEAEGLDAATFAERFAHDADDAVRGGAWARVCLQDATAFVTPVTAEGWRAVDTHYLVCADDRSTTPALQRRHAARARTSAELPTGHHPFLSRPGLVVDEIERFVARI